MLHTKMPNKARFQVLVAEAATSIVTQITSCHLVLTDYVVVNASQPTAPPCRLRPVSTQTDDKGTSTR